MSKFPQKASSWSICAICYKGNSKPPVCLPELCSYQEVVMTSLVKELNHYSKSLIQHMLYQEGILTLKPRVFTTVSCTDAVKPQLFKAW